MATPLGTIDRVGDRPIEHDRIARLVADNDVVRVVVGLPVSLDGGHGPAARAVLSEVRALRKRLPVDVEVVDERLTTVSAEASLRRAGVGGRRRRAVVDQVAASVILQAWIDGQRG